MDEAESAPALTHRARHALASTQAWAGFTGFALLCVALLAAIRGGMQLYRLFGGFHLADVPRVLVAAWFGVAAILSLWVITSNAVLGWFALRYGGALVPLKLLDRSDPAQVAHALDSQHRFWRLQGVLFIAGLVLGILLGVAFGVLAALVRR